MVVDESPVTSVNDGPLTGSSTDAKPLSTFTSTQPAEAVASGAVVALAIADFGPPSAPAEGLTGLRPAAPVNANRDDESNVPKPAQGVALVDPRYQSEPLSPTPRQSHPLPAPTKESEDERTNAIHPYFETIVRRLYGFATNAVLSDKHRALASGALPTCQKSSAHIAR